MRIVILIVIAVVLLLAGGGAAWWFLLGPGAEQTGELVAEMTKPKPAYVAMDPPMVISLIQEGEVTQHITMHVALELTDENDGEETLRRMPPLRDALLTEMHKIFSLRLVREAGFESDLVKQRLLKVCARQLGEGVVSSLILRVVEQRQTPQA